MNDATKQAVLSAVRSILIAIGTFAASKGILDIKAVDDVAGIVLILGPTVWGIWQKYEAERKAKAREVAVANVAQLVEKEKV